MFHDKLASICRDLWRIKRGADWAKARALDDLRVPNLLNFIINIAGPGPRGNDNQGPHAILIRPWQWQGPTVIEKVKKTYVQHG